MEDKFIVIRQWSVKDDSDDWHFYKIANQMLCTQGVINALAPFEIGKLPDADNLLRSYIANDFRLLTSKNAKKIFDGKAGFLGEERDVSCMQKDNIIQIGIDRRPRCILDLENQVIQSLSTDDFNTPFNTELLLGPALIMLLAKRGIFCLHAGAAMSANGLIMFIGESGVGKSTMAKTNGDDWVRVCDDVLPLKLYPDNSLVALPGFAQLKLADSEQHDLDKYQEIPVQAICRITKPKDAERAGVRKKHKTSAVLELVRHTVASKMFNSELLEQHMEFCRTVANTNDVYELSYPREIGKLTKLQKNLTEFAGSIAS